MRRVLSCESQGPAIEFFHGFARNWSSAVRRGRRVHRRIAVTDGPTVRDILGHLGEPTAPPRIAPARGPPLWDLPDAGTGDFDPHAPPPPEYAFDQRLVW